MSSECVKIKSAKVSNDELYRVQFQEALKQCGVVAGKIPKISAYLLESIGFLKNLNHESTLFDFKDKMETTAKLIGVSFEEMVKAAESKPQLFYMSPLTIFQNIEGSARLLEISMARFIKSALKRPQLFYQSPETINYNITMAARLLGVTKERYIKAAEIRPQLFCQLPQTIASHGKLIKRFQDRGVINPETDIEAAFLKQPVLLTYSEDNYNLRYIFARAMNMQDASVKAVLHTSRKDIERQVVAHYGHDPERKTITRPSPVGRDISHEDRQHRALVAMVETGIIKGYSFAPA